MNSSRFFPSPLLRLCLAVATVATAAADPISLHPEATAVAYLKAANHTDVVGTVQFVPGAEGVRVIAHVMNLSPGHHGFHVHEHGDLSAPDLSSAGGHYNPTHEPHAGPDADRRHVGDLGNLVADANGVATADRVDPRLSLEGAHSIIGRAVIIHADPDDFQSQPSGNAGNRVAGGIIQKIRR
jgi:Cu-Zn family superoxide dismutase